MDIKIDPQMVRDVVAGAIMNSLTQEQRNTLITNAVAYLIAPPPATGYNSQRQPSPLESAFNDAMRIQARKIAEEMLGGDLEIQANLRTLITEAVDSLMTKNRAAAVDKIAQAIADGVAGKGY